MQAIHLYPLFLVCRPSRAMKPPTLSVVQCPSTYAVNGWLCVCVLPVHQHANHCYMMDRPVDE